VASVKSFFVYWSEIALSDVDGLLTHISQRNPERVMDIWRQIDRRVEALGHFPYRSRLVPELKALGVEEYREIVIYAYRILLRVRANKVFILGVFDGRRDMEDVLVERILARGEN